MRLRIERSKCICPVVLSSWSLPRSLVPECMSQRNGIQKRRRVCWQEARGARLALESRAGQIFPAKTTTPASTRTSKGMQRPPLSSLSTLSRCSNNVGLHNARLHRKAGWGESMIHDVWSSHSSHDTFVGRSALSFTEEQNLSYTFDEQKKFIVLSNWDN